MTMVKVVTAAQDDLWHLMYKSCYIAGSPNGKELLE
jgi:hypothetical protein